MGLPETLRKRLRADTRAAHDRLDAMASRLDLKRRDDLVIFLKGHRLAYSGLLPEAEVAPPLLSERLTLLDRDLKALGVSRDGRTVPPPEVGLHPLGVRYVIAGSSLGAKVLRKRWAGSSDRAVQNAGAFLCDDGLAPLWSAVVAELEETSAHGESADAVVASATACFDLFADAFAVARETERVRDEQPA